jgi:hypothetical protein
MVNISMQDFTITCPEDWYKIQNTVIAQWKKNHGMFLKDIQRLEKSVNECITDASKSLVLYRQTGRRSCLEAANAHYQRASDYIRTFSKRELLASLSKT